MPFLPIKPLEILGAAAFMRWLLLAFYPYPTLTGIFRLIGGFVFICIG